MYEVCQFFKNSLAWKTTFFAFPNQVLEMDLMSRTDLFDRLLELSCAFTEREAAGMAHNLLLAVRHGNMDTYLPRLSVVCRVDSLLDAAVAFLLEWVLFLANPVNRSFNLCSATSISLSLTSMTTVR